MGGTFFFICTAQTPPPPIKPSSFHPPLPNQHIYYQTSPLETFFPPWKVYKRASSNVSPQPIAILTEESSPLSLLSDLTEHKHITMMSTPVWISFLTLLVAGVAFALEPDRYRIVSQQSSDHVLRYHGVHGKTLAYFKAGGVAEANEWEASIDANHPPGYVFRNVLMGRYLSYKLQEEHGLVILDTNTPTKWDVAVSYTHLRAHET